MTGAAVALEATSPSPGARTHTGGWISTAGHFSLDPRPDRVPGADAGGAGPVVRPAGPRTRRARRRRARSTSRRCCWATRAPCTAASTIGAQPTWEVSQHTRLPVAASSGYHDYQVVWQPGMITWAVDGVAYAQYTRAEARAAGQQLAVRQRPRHLPDRGSRGRGDGRRAGPPTAHTAFPATMEIQSVRVWQ